MLENGDWCFLNSMRDVTMCLHRGIACLRVSINRNVGENRTLFIYALSQLYLKWTRNTTKGFLYFILHFGFWFLFFFYTALCKSQTPTFWFHSNGYSEHIAYNLVATNKDERNSSTHCNILTVEDLVWCSVKCFIVTIIHNFYLFINETNSSRKLSCEKWDQIFSGFSESQGKCKFAIVFVLRSFCSLKIPLRWQISNVTLPMASPPATSLQLVSDYERHTCKQKKIGSHSTYLVIRQDCTENYYHSLSLSLQPWI